MLSRFLRMAALAAALPVLAQDYEIRLHRPDRVGDKTKFSGVCKNRQEMTAWADGKKILEENKDLAVNFEGIGTVLEVSPKGKAKRLSLQVDKLSAMEGKIQKELLPRGTVVVAANVAKKKVFEVNGKAVQPEVARALQLVVSVGSDDHTDDEMYGTRERKRVGDSWDVNRTALMEELSGPNMSVNDIRGQATLKNVLKDAEGTRLFVTFEMTGEGVTAAGGGSMVPGTPTLLKFTRTGEFPTDPSLPCVAETMEASFSARGKRRPAPNGPEMEIRMDMQLSQKAKFTAVK